MTVVVVSWILVLLGVFGLNYAHDVLAESRLIRLEVQHQQLRAWARSGIELAIITLENTAPVECASLGYSGLANPFSFSMNCGDGQFTVGRTCIFNGKEQWLPGIRDEASRLPVALLDSVSLACLPGMNKHGAQVILNAKRTAGIHRLSPFNMLPDLDDASLECAEQFISRYGNAVNINTAPIEVLVAAGLPKRLATKLLGMRSGPDDIPGTTDDRHFLSLESNTQMIRDCFLNSEEAAVLAFLYGKKILSVESHFFHFVSRSWAEGYNGICEIRVVLEKPEQGTAQVMEWTENWLN